MHVTANRLAAITALFGLAGCAYMDHARHWAGDFVPSCAISRDDGTGMLEMKIETAICTSDPFVHSSLWLTDLSAEQIESGHMDHGQILHIEMLFPPRPGETPIDPDATNLSIRYILISDGEVGIYEGGGFGYPIGSHTDESMSLRVKPSGMVLAESTKGFVDLLSPGTIAAVFTGACDDPSGHRLADGVDQFVTNVFQRTLYVSAE